MSQLTSMIKCRMTDRGGTLPVVDGHGETSIRGIYSAGDAAGIEEASSAMINGRIAGTAAAAELGYLDEAASEERLPVCARRSSSSTRVCSAQPTRAARI